VGKGHSQTFKGGMHDVEKHLFHCNGIIFKEFHTDSKIKNT